MIQLPLVGDRVLVFDIEDARELRLLGICGVLNGTLPAAPQQNVFLGLPLQLLPEDVIWLVEKGYAEVIDGLSSINHDKEDVESWNNSHLINIRDHKQEELLIAKLKKLSLPEETLTPRIDAIRAAGDKKNFTVIPDCGPKSNSPLKFDLKTILQQLLPTDPRKYHVYRYLKSQGIYILPGLRFGGDFLGYPNDPLRYHAHYIVNSDDKLRLMEIITGGRLATGVKKVWVIAAEKSDDRKFTKKITEKAFENTDMVQEITRQTEISCYSIEWAGCG